MIIAIYPHPRLDLTSEMHSIEILNQVQDDGK